MGFSFQTVYACRAALFFPKNGGAHSKKCPLGSGIPREAVGLAPGKKNFLIF